MEKNNFSKIDSIDQPIAAASIAKYILHKLKVKFFQKSSNKNFKAEIEAVFNKELDALMLLAYLIESIVQKQSDSS